MGARTCAPRVAQNVKGRWQVERRNFLRTLVGGVAVAAAARNWPFRVYSFPSEVAPANTFVLGESFFISPGENIMFLHPAQEAALHQLQYRVTKVDHASREITFENIRQSQYNWKNLSRSPQPFRDGAS